MGWFFNAIFNKKDFLVNVEQMLFPDNSKQLFSTEDDSPEEKVKGENLVDFLTNYKEIVFKIKQWGVYRHASVSDTNIQTEKYTSEKERYESDLVDDFANNPDDLQSEAIERAKQDRLFAQKLGYSLGWDWGSSFRNKREIVEIS